MQTCPVCHSERVIKFGQTAFGNPRSRCRACGKTFCPGGDKREHDESLKEQVLAALQERCSQRGAYRIFGVSRSTVARWLREKNSEPTSV